MRRVVPLILALMMGCAMVALRVGGAKPLELLELRAFDYRLQQRGPETPSSDVVLVTVDDASLHELGRWPWSRSRVADLLARIAEIDRQLREAAHSLESRSIVSRPLAEILHREVEAFQGQAEIETTLVIQGDPEILGPQQRVAVFRAIQEALSNVREHSGATTVEIRLHMRRNWIEVKVTDNGHGFEVNRSLAHAAQRGRLGIVGMGERMRILGGTFDIESTPGGPTVLRFSLPRWEPFETPGGGHH